MYINPRGKKAGIRGKPVSVGDRFINKQMECCTLVISNKENEMKNNIMNARVTKSLMYPEQGSPEFFERHKIIASRAIEDAIINNQYECVIIDSDLYIGGDYEEDKIITYLKWLGYSVESYSEDGLGIKISWGY